MVYSIMESENVHPAGLTYDIKEFCLRSGAAIVGIADLGPLMEGLHTDPPDLFQPYTAAISIALPLDMSAVAAMRGEPTPAYASDCKDINARLNAMTEAIVKHIESLGYRAEAVPASKKLVEGGTEGSVSHKAIAIMAGLGWQGKSLLLVTSKYGPRVRLSSVLTDIPLEFDSPMKNRCGNCTKCAEACPAGAIRNINTDFHYSNRDEALDLDKCHSNTLKYMEVPGVGYTFCGQCIPVCPHGGKLMLREAGLMDEKKRSNITQGLKVRIVSKPDQKSGKLTEGIVKDILTNSLSHPHGIKVRLTSGDIGRVKEICR